MKTYFNVNFEFDHDELENKINNTANSGKGYCCFIDLNSLVHSYKDTAYRDVLNSALVNSCDGSYIAIMAGKIHNERLKEYIGPDFFKKFIFSDSKHLIIGNTEQVFNKIKERVNKEGGKGSNLHYLPVPFKKIDEFDYNGIGSFINNLSPDYIWVSLGAPKQEQFMNKLLPYITRGVMLGVGAATNYFSGEIKDIPAWTKKLHVVWIYRIFTEPKKQLKRTKTVLVALPEILKEERMKVKLNKGQIHG